MTIIKNKTNVILRDSDIIINRMDHPSCVTAFIRCMNLAIKRKRKEINVICKCEKGSIFPDACLPISALIQNYSRLYDVKFNVIINNDKYLQHCHFDEPLDCTIE